MSDRFARGAPRNEVLTEQTVTYYIEIEGRLVLIENVPARVNVETGERHFSPETVERLQHAVWERYRPVRVIETRYSSTRADLTRPSRQASSRRGTYRPRSNPARRAYGTRQLACQRESGGTEPSPSCIQAKVRNCGATTSDQSDSTSV